MRRPREKHIPYFEMLESLQKAKGCALCELLRRSIHAYFENLLYENVNNPDVRAKLARSRGFCGRHAHALLSFSDHMGIAILCGDQMKLAISFLDKLHGRDAKTLRKNARKDWERHDRCPGCELEAQSDEARIETLLEGLNESEMREAMDGSPGLCIPHLIEALSVETRTEMQHYLVDLHLSKYSELLVELQEFCRKQDYRYSKETVGKEKDSWQRAVWVLVGRRDLGGMSHG